MAKITKILNSEENSKRKVCNQMANQMIKHIKRIENNCHIPDLVQAFSNVENGALNLVFRQRMTIVYNAICLQV